MPTPPVCLTNVAFRAQILGVAVAVVYATIVTYILLRILDNVRLHLPLCLFAACSPSRGMLCNMQRLKGLRLCERDEMVGVDWVEHRETAYHDLFVLVI